MVFRSLLALVVFFQSLIAGAEYPQQTIGWRGNGTGLYPDAQAPVEWSNICMGPVEGMKYSTAPPADGSDRGAALVEAGLVGKWLVIGPFPVENGPTAFSKELIPNEAKLAPHAGEKAEGLSWKEAQAVSEGVNFVGVNITSGAGKLNQVGYAHSYLYARTAGRVRAVIEHVVATKIYVNGEDVYSDPEQRTVMGSAYGLSRNRLANAYPLAPSLEFDVKQGWNRLTLKLVSPDKKQWCDLAFYLRLMDVPAAKYERKNIVWMTPLPDRSHATPIIVGDKLFVMAEPDELIAVDKQSGKVLWNAMNDFYEATPPAERDAQPAFKEKIDPLARQVREAQDLPKRRELRKKLQDALLEVDKKKYRIKLSGHYQEHFDVVGFATTPCSDGHFVYVNTGAGVVACYDLDGKRQWIRRMEAKELVYPSAPAVIEGKLAVVMGYGDGQLYGLDARNGEITWTQEVRANVAAMLAARIAGTAVFIDRAGDVFRASDGKVLWRSPPPSGLPDSTGWCPPVALGNVLYIPRNGYSGVVIADFSACRGETWKPGVVSFGELYKDVPPPPPAMQLDRFSAGSPLVHDGLMYGVDWYGMYYVIDLKAKKKLMHKDLELKGEYNYVSMGVCASPTLIGKHIVVMNNQGLALVLEPGSGCRVVARNRLATQIQRDWPITTIDYAGYSPPVADGTRMYLRGERYLYCIGEK